jgi:uncharacterized membrane protein required for colicin V production
MPWIIDLILIALFAVTVFFGYRKGFLRTVLGFGRLIATILLTYAFGKPFSAWIDRRFVHPRVYESVLAKLTELADSAEGSIASFLDGLPARYRLFVDVTNPDTSGGVGGLVEQYAPTISTRISQLLSTVIGYILLFILLYLVISLVVYLTGKLADLPIIRGVDRFLGLAVGVINGVLLTCLIATILYGIVYLTGKIGLYERSMVFKFLCELRLFSRIFNAIL